MGLKINKLPINIECQMDYQNLIFTNQIHGFLRKSTTLNARYRTTSCKNRKNQTLLLLLFSVDGIVQRYRDKPSLTMHRIGLIGLKEAFWWAVWFPYSIFKLLVSESELSFWVLLRSKSGWSLMWFFCFGVGENWSALLDSELGTRKSEGWTRWVYSAIRLSHSSLRALIIVNI